MTSQQTIKKTPSSERPRERCLEKGPQCLSLRECIALILGSGPPLIGCMGLASQILSRPGEGLGSENEERAFFSSMEGSPMAHLKEVHGLGPAGQARLLAAFELGRRYAIHREGNHRSHRTSTPPSHATLSPIQQALDKISQTYRSDPKEWLGFVPIHTPGEVGELCIVEKGVRTHVNIDPAELFARILALRPKGFILFHNHPSGTLSPSRQDLDLTERIHAIAKQFGIQLLGHWIVTPRNERWISVCT